MAQLDGPRDRDSEDEVPMDVCPAAKREWSHTREGEAGLHKGIRDVGDGEVLRGAGPHQRLEHGHA